MLVTVNHILNMIPLESFIKIVNLFVQNVQAKGDK